MLKKKSAFLVMLILMTLLFSLGVVSNASAHASASTVLSIQSVPRHTPLLHCSVTLETATHTKQCLVQETTNKALSTQNSDPGCALMYYQNGPYGSSAMRNGWAICVAGTPGYVPVPKQYNDQASAWDSCSDGYFYKDGANTYPDAYFPAHSSGNFPWGAVPNDSLSYIWFSTSSSSC